jgi:hypothetical protein
MTRRRWILLALLVIPLALVVLGIVFQSELGEPPLWVEYPFLLVGVPIVIVNVWEWSEPELLDKLWKKETWGLWD